MNAGATDIIRECWHHAEEDVFDKDRFKELIAEISYSSFNDLCLDALRLEFHHTRSVGKWCTECPEEFAGGRAAFFKIPFGVEPADLPLTGIWPFLDAARLTASSSARTIFLKELAAATDQQFYYFCNNMLKLELHKGLVTCLYFTAEPDELKKEIACRENADDLLFQLSPVNRTSPLIFTRGQSF